jgi:hypothetical protein
VMYASASRYAPVAATAASVKPTAPHAIGSIEWAGTGGEGPNAGRRKYVILSDGTLRPQ